MAGAARPRGAEGQLALAGAFAVGDQLLDVLHRQIVVHHQDVGRGDDRADRQQIRAHVVRHVLDERRRHRIHRRAGEEGGVAVGRRLRGEVAAERAARAALVLDEYRLVHRLAKARGDHATDRIGHAAGTVGHDEPDRLRWISVLRRSREGPKQGCDGNECFHDEPYPPPPAVSMITRSPARRTRGSVGSTCSPFTSRRPGWPAPPPARPAGTDFNCVIRNDAVASFASARSANSKRKPSPPRWRPAPPLARRISRRSTRIGARPSITSTGVLPRLAGNEIAEKPARRAVAPWPAFMKFTTA